MTPLHRLTAWLDLDPAIPDDTPLSGPYGRHLMLEGKPAGATVGDVREAVRLALEAQAQMTIEFGGRTYIVPRGARHIKIEQFLAGAGGGADGSVSGVGGHGGVTRHDR